jgi:hypothetical protein
VSSATEFLDAMRFWVERRQDWDRLGAYVSGAAIATEVIVTLERLQVIDSQEVLRLVEASAISGYSTDHLSRLIRHGVVPNAGRKGAPRIKRSDVPIRPAVIATDRKKAYDVRTDARSLRVRR